MTDPFPELPRRVLYVDVTKPWSPCRSAMKPVPVTKIPATKVVQRNATKAEDATKMVLSPNQIGLVPEWTSDKKRGRPAKGNKPMTSTERSRLRRAAKKQSSS